METNEMALRPGTVLQGLKYKYVIDKVLGQGSFGITYLARTTVTVAGDLGRLNTEVRVAVKEFFMRDINEREGSEVSQGSKGGLFVNYKRKFSREASNLGKLQHPGIINVLETFEANGTAYYSMEYCGGGSLDDLIAGRGCLSEAEALRYTGQIARALTFMHSHRMLHLDLKPGNVMLRDDGEAVLIDFGLSKQYDENGEPESSTTIGGGTPGYAPIEQANYREGKVFPVTMDVYALGATLFKMLTGQRPPVASDVLIEFPEAALRSHNVSGKTIAAIRRAMEAKPSDRFQSVADFAAALGIATNADDNHEDTIIDDKKGPIPTPPPIPTPTPIPNPDQSGQNRKKWLLPVVGAIVGVVVGAVLVVALLSDDSTTYDETITYTDDYAVDSTVVEDVTAAMADSVVADSWYDDVEEETAADAVAAISNISPKEEALPEIEMVYVSGGEFTMGATSQMEGRAWEDEYPAHQVTLSSYYISKYEVTQRLWKAVMGSNPSEHVGDNLPVENVTWHDVQRFLSKLNSMTGKNYRLPSEAEWEYAARGGRRSYGYIFSGSNSLGSVAWYESNSGGCTHPVGAKSPNELGLYDMTGNVIEWVQDRYAPYTADAQVDPVVTSGNGDERVIKGGSWSSVEKGSHVSFRYGENPSNHDGKQGFRLAL